MERSWRKIALSIGAITALTMSPLVSVGVAYADGHGKSDKAHSQDDNKGNGKKDKGGCGAYCANPDDHNSQNKNHEDGSVGNADNKNPKGQAPDGSDHNHGYECDKNHGIGDGNPAHTVNCPTHAPSPKPSWSPKPNPSPTPTHTHKPKPSHKPTPTCSPTSKPPVSPPPTHAPPTHKPRPPHHHPTPPPVPPTHRPVPPPHTHTPVPPPHPKPLPHTGANTDEMTLVGGGAVGLGLFLLYLANWRRRVDSDE